MTRPTAAPAHFPYAHRTMAKLPASPTAGETMLCKGWWPGYGKLRIEPIRVPGVGG